MLDNFCMIRGCQSVFKSVGCQKAIAVVKRSEHDYLILIFLNRLIHVHMCDYISVLVIFI